jgi:hypothetical protein
MSAVYIVRGGGRCYRAIMSTEPKGLNEDGGCAVDWRWLTGEQVASMTNGLDTLTFTFGSGRTFTVRALLWQGKPFLAFDPYQPPA